MKPKELRFKRRWLAWILSACASGFLLIGLSGLITEQAGSSSFLFFVAVTAISMLLVVRSFRMANTGRSD